MKFNKYTNQKVNDKKILRKHKKQWIIVSITTLALLGGSQLVVANADTTATTTTNDDTNNQTTSQSKTDTNNSNAVELSQTNTKQNTTNDTSQTSSATSTTSSNARTSTNISATTSSAQSQSTTSTATNNSSTNTNVTSSATQNSSAQTNQTSQANKQNITSANTNQITSTTSSNDNSQTNNDSSHSSTTNSNHSAETTNSQSSQTNSSQSSNTSSASNNGTNSSDTKTEVLNATNLNELMNSNNNLKTQLISQFNLQAVSTDDLGTELLNRISTDATQQGVLLNLINNNPVPGNGLYPSTKTNNDSTEITITFNPAKNDTAANVSSSYPQYVQFGKNSNYYFVPNDNNGNSIIDGLTGITVQTSVNGTVNTTQIPINNQVPANSVVFNKSMTKNDIYNQGLAVPLNQADVYWNDTALTNGARTYTVLRIDGRANNPTLYLSGDDYVKYSIDFTRNAQYTDPHTTGYSQTAYYYTSYITPSNQVNYIDMNGNNITNSQYLDSAGVNVNNTSYYATVPSSAGYITYQVTSSISGGNGQASINSDGSVSISGIDSLVNPYNSSQTNKYNITYVKPTVKTTSKTISQNVNFVDTNGNQLAPSVNQQTTITQNAVYDALTNNLLGYVPAGQTFNNDLNILSSSDSNSWNYTNGNQFTTVNAKDLSSQGYQAIDIASIARKVVNSNTSNQTYNIVYNKIPTPPSSITATLVRNVTLVDSNTNQTINYNQGGYSNGVLTNQISNTYPPKAIYQTPAASTDSNITKVANYITGYSDITDATLTLNNQNVPDLSSLGYTSGNPTQINSVSGEFTQTGTQTKDITISYAHATTRVNSSDAKTTNDVIAGTNTHYPSNITQSDLQTVFTRTINYVDLMNLDNIKHVAAPSVTQTVMLYRDAIVDNVTGKLLGYTKPNQTEIVNDPIFAWATDVKQLDPVTSPDLSKQGFSDPNIKTVRAYDLSGPFTDLESGTNVAYYHKFLDISPNQTINNGDLIPGTNNQYPSGVTTNNLNHPITRTIEYQDATTGKIIAPTITQSINYYRYASLDEVDGTFIYTDSNGHKLQDQTSWLSDKTQFDAVTSPSMTAHGYTDPDVNQVDSYQTNQNDTNQTVIVKYQHATEDIKSDNPKASTDKIDNSDAYYPDNIKDGNLNSTVTRTIQYKDATTGQTIAPNVNQVIKFHRNVKIDKVTGELLGYTDDNGNIIDTNNSWLTPTSLMVAVSSPILNNRGYQSADTPSVNSTIVQPYQNDMNVVVTYQHDMVTVKANDPKSTNEDVNEANTPYPSGVNTHDLNHQVTRTIQYQDATNDKNIAPTVTQTVAFYRNARVDAVTGQLVGYTDDNDNLLSNNQWLSTNPTFDSVESPNLQNHGYKVPNITTEPKLTVQVNDNDIQQNVKYDHDTVIVNANQPKTNNDKIDSSDANYPTGVNTDDLNHDVTRTINYINVRNKSIHEPTVQTVHFNRNALVDKVTGQLLGYVDQNNQLVTDEKKAWYSTHPQFDTVNLPNLVATGYETPSKDTIDSQDVTVDTPNQTMTSLYQDHLITVYNTAPKTSNDIIEQTNIKYPSGVSQNDLNQSHSRIIQYQDTDGNQLANSTVQTARFNRNAIVNVATGEIVKYTDWQNNNAQFDGVNIPYPDGYDLVGNTTLNGYINGMTMNVNGNDVVQTVQYTKTKTPTTTNTKPTAPTTNPVVQNNRYQIIDGQSVKATDKLPAGLQPNDLKKTITRTINYVQVTNHQSKIVKTIVQTVNYYRTAIIDLTNNTLVGYADGENGDAMDNPENAWYSSNKSFKAIKTIKFNQGANTEYRRVNIPKKHVTVNTANSMITIKSKSTHHKKPVQKTAKPTKHQKKHQPLKPVDKKPMLNHQLHAIKNKAIKENKKTTFVNKQTKTLPQTNGANEEWLQLIGLIAMITSGLYLGFSYKKNRK